MNESNFEYTPDLYVLQVNWPQRLEKEKPFFAKIISSRNVKNILDIGCGTGPHVASLASKGIDVIGIDISPSMIEKAKENYPNYKFSVGLSTPREHDQPTGSLPREGFPTLSESPPTSYETCGCRR